MEYEKHTKFDSSKKIVFKAKANSKKKMDTTGRCCCSKCAAVFEAAASGNPPTQCCGNLKATLETCLATFNRTPPTALEIANRRKLALEKYRLEYLAKNPNATFRNVEIVDADDDNNGGEGYDEID